MGNMNLPPEYATAEGPEGLREALDDFLKKSRQDAEFAAKMHYILYRLASQKSLIKVDLSKQPYQFWYYDFLGRPATRIVKEVIARFLWEKCGEREKYLDE